MAALVESERPNIRVEIQNEKMDVDPDVGEVDEDVLLDENEEGEIVDEDDDGGNVPVENTPRENLHISILTQPPDENKVNTKKVFTTGINIFDKEAQGKLQERAKRFALKPDEIRTFTDADLAELYESLGINNKNEADNRFDAVHVIGISGMTAEDILEYFAKYAPTEIEWVDKDSCNVVWVENISAARAMFYTSKAVNGMPAREPVDTFAKEFLDDAEEEPTGESILVKHQKKAQVTITDILPHKVNIKSGVDISEITIPVPPGYWRLGEKHPKSKCLLMRYAQKTDMKPYKVEDLARYYRKLGMERNSRQESTRGIFERNRDLPRDKNPWGALARNWNKDRKFCEPEPNLAEPQVEILNPRLLVRLGKKPQPPPEEEEELTPEAQEEGEIIPEKKSDKKLPRMRMYADEEEEKQRRKRLLQTIKRQTDELMKESQSKVKDLRNMLKISDIVKRIPPKEIIDLAEENNDLSSRLRDRAERMVVTVRRDTNVERGDARRLIGRKHSPIVYDRRSQSASRSPIRKDDRLERYTSPVRRRSPPNPHRHIRPMQHRRSPPRMTMYSDRPERSSRSYNYRTPSYHDTAGTLHSDRMYSRKRRHSDYEEEDDYYNSGKPKSKVAVVIRKRKRPTVPSTVWSRTRSSPASEGSESESSDSESSGSSESSSSDDSDSDSSGSDSSDSDSDSSGKGENKSVSVVVKQEETAKLNHKPMKVERDGPQSRRT